MTPPGQSKSNAIVMFGMTLLIAFCFGSSLTAWFHGDDFVHVALLSQERDGVMSNIWKGSLTGNAPDHNYRPIAYTAFYLLNTGDSAIYLRLFVLALHMLTTCLLFRVLQADGIDRLPAAGGALIFALHPGAQPTVLWVSALGDVLTTFFCILAISIYLEKPRGLLRISTLLLCYAGAALSKETGFVLPALLMLFAWKRNELFREWRSWLAFFVFGLLILVIRSHLLENFAAGPRTGHYFTPGLHTLLSLAKYAYALLIPFPWHWTYAHAWLAGFGLLAPVGIIILLARKGIIRGGMPLLVSAGMIALPLLPVINVFANWYLYMPMIGIGFIAAHILHALPRRGTMIISCVLVSWFGITGVYNSLNFVRAGNMEKALLAELAQKPENEFMAIGMPRQYRGVPMITFSHHLELALERYHGTTKSIALPTPAAYSCFAHEVTWNQTSPGILELKLPSATLDYFDLFKERGEPWRPYINVLKSNRWGFPVSLELTLPRTLPLYIYQGEGHGERFVRIEDKRIEL
ncbi:MAG TPA: hypothetical protein PJ991_02855 [Kiritimatiellia bacterium]|nr:hypothetical protein [Kiritimatiellia bacterium]